MALFEKLFLYLYTGMQGNRENGATSSGKFNSFREKVCLLKEKGYNMKCSTTDRWKIIQVYAYPKVPPYIEDILIIKKKTRTVLLPYKVREKSTKMRTILFLSC